MKQYPDGYLQTKSLEELYEMQEEVLPYTDGTFRNWVISKESRVQQLSEIDMEIKSRI